MIQTLLHSSCVILGTNEARLFKTASRQNAKTKRLAAWIAVRILKMRPSDIANSLGYADRYSTNTACRIIDEHIKQRNFEIIELIYHICNHSNTIPKNYGGTYSPSTWLKTLLQFIPLGHENMRRTRGKTSQTATTATKQHSSVTSPIRKRRNPRPRKRASPPCTRSMERTRPSTLRRTETLLFASQWRTPISIPKRNESYITQPYVTRSLGEENATSRTRREWRNSETFLTPYMYQWLIKWTHKKKSLR